MTLKTDITRTPNSQLFPLVGIGASAGGLGAFKQLVAAIPEKSGTAYVIVQHLSPTHESALPEILQKFSKIPVREIPDEVEIEPNTIYVIPSNKILTTTDGILKLAPRDSVKTSLIIDVFFTSLAVVRGSLSVGVVLSGSGSDGTLGLKMIRDYGGITIAQDQHSATFAEMPLSAINAGVVDFVLAPERIPEHLSTINRTSHTGFHSNTNEDQDTPVDKDDSSVFKRILTLLYQYSGVDFIYYKQNTLRRRIARRMAMHKKTNLIDYLRLLRSDKGELQALFQDMLIPGTSFFRDIHLFEHLVGGVFPDLFINKSSKDPIRIWVAGCSTGEEAYSMAICIHELLGEKALSRKIQVFASDISESGIKKARTGIYTKEEVNTISQERLDLYFSKSQGHYVVNKAIRNSCVFAVHNFLKDPPFAKMDFISCRNVFIYMEPFLQKKALTMFHYALNANGVLMLGKSETIGAAPELFSSVKNTDKIYFRKPVPGRFMHVTTQKREETLMEQNRLERKSDPVLTDYRKIAEAIMIDKSPASVIVNQQMEIVHIHGDINPFLRPSPGKPTFNIFKMAREGLSFDLRNVLHKAKLKPSALYEEITIKEGESKRVISIEITPLPNTVEPYFLIFFRESISEYEVPPTTQSSAAQNLEARNKELEKELKQLRNDLREIMEDHDSANEELQSVNEELQSSNEELQSLNEELETSKEELQSANEELTISNQELLEKHEQVHAARFYAEAIVSTIREPLVVLDKRFLIRTANESFLRKFGVKDDEIEGRAFPELWHHDELHAWLRKVPSDKTKADNLEITLKIEQIDANLILSAQQIDSELSREELILLAIEDVTDSVLNKRLQQSERRFRQLAEQIPHLVFTATPEGYMNYANERLLEFTGKKLEDLSEAGWLKRISASGKDDPTTTWSYYISKKEKVNLELPLQKSDGSITWHLMSAIPQLDNEGKILLWIGTFTNIQQQKSFTETLEEKVKDRTKELEKTNHQLNQFAYTASHDLQEPLRKIMTYSTRLKQTEAKALPENITTQLTKIEQASTRMSVLIRDLLNYSRISDSKVLFQKTDLNIVLSSILEDFEILIEEKGARITNEPLPEILAIPLHMNQLFYNLVGNALKFSKKGVAPILTITSRKLSPEETRKYVELDQGLIYHQMVFKDNGIGFNEKYAKQIFIMFQRLNRPSQYSGTGIGLALSKKIVEIHQGEIFAVPKVNEGVEFYVILPETQKNTKEG